MNKLLLSCLLAAASALSQTAEPAGPPPSDVNPAIAAAVQKEGVRVMEGKKAVMEIWFRNAAPTGAKNAEQNVTLSSIPHGAFMGLVRFPERGSDRRGQTVKPGLYTMRLSFFPPNGDHQGVAPQRDFFLLTTAAEDKDPNANISYDALTKASMKASGTPHPLVFSAWRADTEFKAGLAQQGDHDWVLQHKIGDVPVAMIVIGKVDH